MYTGSALVVTSLDRGDVGGRQAQWQAAYWGLQECLAFLTALKSRAARLYTILISAN